MKDKNCTERLRESVEKFLCFKMENIKSDTVTAAERKSDIFIFVFLAPELRLQDKIGILVVINLQFNEGELN